MADLSQATRDAVREGAKRSAAVVLPMVFEYLGTPTVMLDAGCGERHWCKAAEDLGVLDAIGADLMGLGDYAWDAEAHGPLPMPSDVFPLWRGSGKWPLALCLEMAEHVSPAAGGHLVAELCRVANAVLWSAAIPGQGGDGHVNEQWPEYWAKLFDAQGWTLGDEFRDALWMHPEVEPWYRQNLLLAIPADHPFILPGDLLPPRALVDPVTWAHHRGVHPPSVV